MKLAIIVKLYFVKNCFFMTGKEIHTLFNKGTLYSYIIKLWRKENDWRQHAYD